MQSVAKLPLKHVVSTPPVAESVLKNLAPVENLMAQAVKCVLSAYEVKLHPEHPVYFSNLQSTMMAWRSGLQNLLDDPTIRSALHISMQQWLYLQLPQKSRIALKHLRSCSTLDFINHVEVFSKLLPKLSNVKTVVKCLYLILQQPLPHTTPFERRRLAIVKHRVCKIYQRYHTNPTYHAITNKMFCTTEKKSILCRLASQVTPFIAGVISAVVLLTLYSPLFTTCSNL